MVGAGPAVPVSQAPFPAPPVYRIRLILKHKLMTRHGVQRRMISVVNFFVFLRLLFFALLLLHDVEAMYGLP